MAPTATQHRRTHNLLLLNNLIGQQSTVSPFTLVLDTLEQAASPLISEYVRRATEAKVRTVFVSFETLQRPQGVECFIQAWDQSLTAWQKQIVNETTSAHAQPRRTLLIFDSLNVAAVMAALQLPALLSSFITPMISLLAVYHTDIPFASQKVPSHAPSPLSLFSYLATSILTVHSLHHVLAKKAARDRSVVAPLFGVDEAVDGVLQGLGANSANTIVLEMEHRRKSGRGVSEWYVLQGDTDANSRHALPANSMRRLCLLEDYPGYKIETLDCSDEKADASLSTFELGLTDKQRRDREGVVLPYFDAQKGSVEGGRILYDMGSEDDFDEEEDEI